MACGDENFTPVSALNPYVNTWRIKVRCTKKDDIRTWNNDRGTGKVFSVDLLDSEGTEIRATMFNDAADQFYQVFDVNKVFIISKGKVKVANKRFTHIKNDYSLSLEASSEVQFVGDDDGSIDAQHFDFVSISDINNMQPNSYVDLCAVVNKVEELAEITSKRTGKELTKRTLGLVDQSGTAIDVTLWEDEARKADESILHQVVCVKAARVSDFGGKSLNLSTPMIIGANRKECNDLASWWKSQGSSQGVQSLSGKRMGGGTQRLTIAEVTGDANHGMKEKPDYFEMLATVTSISHNPERPPWYDACPEEGCNKKLMPDSVPGSWTCAADACQGKTYHKKQPRYIMRFATCDSTGNKWVTAFNEGAEQILGCPASTVSDFNEAGDSNSYEAVFKNACFKPFIFKCRSKADSYRDEMRVKTTVMDVRPVDWIAEAKLLAEKIEAM